MKKIFGSGISPKCIYCETGINTKDGKEVLCRRMGVMQPDSFCKMFKYDPLKRQPEVLKMLSGFKEEDFSL